MTVYSRVLTILSIVFLANGVGLLIAVAVLLGSDFSKTVDGERAEGVVIEARDNDKPLIEFRTRTGERVRIRGTVSASPTPYTRGERIGVFYDPANPADALIDSFLERWFLPLLFGGFATVFTGLGGVFLALILRRRRRWKHLLRTGQRVDGHIVGFERNLFAKINGRRPWQVVADWTGAGGHMRRGHSEMLREDPQKRFKLGDRVTVFFDPLDPKIFWIDVLGTAASVIGGSGSSGTGFGGNAKASSFGKNTGNPVIRRR